jgi:hypothetical protein
VYSKGGRSTRYLVTPGEFFSPHCWPTEEVKTPAVSQVEVQVRAAASGARKRRYGATLSAAEGSPRRSKQRTQE